MEQAQYPTNTREWVHGQGIQRVWFGGGGKMSLYLVSNRDVFLGIYPIGMVPYPIEVIDGWDHLMHAIEVGGEVA